MLWAESTRLSEFASHKFFLLSIACTRACGPTNFYLKRTIFEYGSSAIKSTGSTPIFTKFLIGQFYLHAPVCRLKL